METCAGQPVRCLIGAAIVAQLRRELTEIGVVIRMQYFIHATGPLLDIRDGVLRDALEALATEGFTIPTVQIDEKPLRPLERPQTTAQAFLPATSST